ncbi:MAG: hypothetical protein R3E94_19980 [Burkholderiaceae bacterium]
MHARPASGQPGEAGSDLTRGRSRPWLTVFAVLLPVGMLVALLSGNDSFDEWWFLQVLARVASGEHLYRDVFYGAAPLAVWLELPAVAVFGEHLWVTRGMLALIWATTGTCLWQLAADLRLGRASRWTMLVAFLALSPPIQLGWGSPYAPLANGLLLGSALLMARYATDPNRTNLWTGACTLAGLALAAKQNVGAYVLVALTALFLLHAHRPAGQHVWQPALRMLTGWAAGLGAFGITLLPVLLRGDLMPMLDYTVFNKPGYLRQGSIGYIESLLRLIDSQHGLELAMSLCLYSVPVLGGIAWAALLWWPGRPVQRAARPVRGVLVVMAAFWGVSMLSVWPRVDPAHVPTAVPLSLLGMWLWWHHRSTERPVWRNAWAAAVLLCLTLPLAYRLSLPLTLARHGYGWGATPHLRWILTHTRSEQRQQAMANALRDLSADGPVMVISNSAARYYLTGGFANPTRFDYPQSTTFGRHGQQEVIDAIEAGYIPWVCLGMGRNSLLPTELVAHVRTHMQVVDRNNLPCRLYRWAGQGQPTDQTATIAR